MPTFKIAASIIILGYNGLDYIDGCIQSVLDQDFPAENYEVIWADNASCDGSKEYIQQKYPEIQLIQFDTNYGFAEGNNRAAKDARGRHLVLLNQDTIVHKCWLRTLVETMDNHNNLAACQGNMLMPWHPEFKSFDRIGYPERVHYQDVDQYGCIVYREHPMQKSIIPSLGLAGAAFIINRTITERMPYIFDPLFITNAEDLDLALRIRSMGYGIAVAPRAVLFHLQFSKMSNIRYAYRRAYLTTRNRILAHYKSMPSHHFYLSLPKFLLGGVIKMREFQFAKYREIFTMAAMIPISIVALLGAIKLMPNYRDYKRLIKCTPNRQSQVR